MIFGGGVRTAKTPSFPRVAYRTLAGVSLDAGDELAAGSSVGSKVNLVCLFLREALRSRLDGIVRRSDNNVAMMFATESFPISTRVLNDRFRPNALSRDKAPLSLEHLFSWPFTTSSIH